MKVRSCSLVALTAVLLHCAAQPARAHLGFPLGGDGGHELFLAVHSNNEQRSKELVKAGAELNWVNKQMVRLCAPAHQRRGLLCAGG